MAASDVVRFTNSTGDGKFLCSFPYAVPSHQAQPGWQDFDLAGDIHYKDPYVQHWT